MTAFRPALVIVDVQEDFCPPSGALAVQDGRDIVPAINELLSLDFVLKVATKDFHPPDHVSFASNHTEPNNKPFESLITIQNPLNPEETQETRLWPDHCVQGTMGSELLPELNATEFHHIVEKGQDKRVEMYSAFADPFVNPNVSRSELAKLLRDKQISDVYIAGLAADYCVKYTALDAAKEGFKTWVLPEVTKAVDPTSLEDVHKGYETAGISLITVDATRQRLEGAGT
ncbi:Isochorismatase hydrolase [Aaosphaeria arxii CBS 175.79]|uniref:nicotinamidase n=1 Tax=Aaosphaeria arxii CBS 175.79 TaxID=1450172 RepID=A0A6A5XBS0_9PLEO|nr:Isochorismatase hydrolase [Aaosphaeria arxii CBS 175.79]KAF2010535.1 Isochorismatase hydrolase [Aaosphaeria arxii CBS 175.79]